MAPTKVISSETNFFSFQSLSSLLNKPNHESCNHLEMEITPIFKAHETNRVGTVLNTLVRHVGNAGDERSGKQQRPSCLSGPCHLSLASFPAHATNRGSRALCHLISL